MQNFEQFMEKRTGRTKEERQAKKEEDVRKVINYLKGIEGPVTFVEMCQGLTGNSENMPTGMFVIVFNLLENGLIEVSDERFNLTDLGRKAFEKPSS